MSVENFKTGNKSFTKIKFGVKPLAIEESLNEYGDVGLQWKHKETKSGKKVDFAMFHVSVTPNLKPETSLMFVDSSENANRAQRLSVRLQRNTLSVEQMIKKCKDEIEVKNIHKIDLLFQEETLFSFKILHCIFESMALAVFEKKLERWEVTVKTRMQQQKLQCYDYDACTNLVNLFCHRDTRSICNGANNAYDVCSGIFVRKYQHNIMCDNCCHLLHYHFKSHSASRTSPSSKVKITSLSRDELLERYRKLSNTKDSIRKSLRRYKLQRDTSYSHKLVENEMPHEIIHEIIETDRSET